MIGDMKRVGRLLLLAGLFLSLMPTVAEAQSDAPPVIQLEATGVVDPFLADYLTSEIASANESGAGAILITIDTPGGSGSATQEITTAMLESDVPIITFVEPAGARASSAGTFILMAGSVAAMAPGTSVGAAHPVGIEGVVQQEKATNAAVSWLVSIAEARDRSTEFAEAAVRDSKSISAEQALTDDVVDLLAPDVPTLLDDIDGMQAPVADGTATLETADATVTEESMNGFFAFLHGLFGPDTAFILFWLGLLLVILEFFVPGGLLGVLGALMLLVAVISVGMLPVQLLGIGFLIASVVLFVIELHQPGLGLPAILGMICLVLGGFTLFDRDVPGATVSPLVIVTVAVLVALFFAFAIQAALRLRGKPAVEPTDLVGQEGVVVRALDPAGTIRLGAEEWSADVGDDEAHMLVGARVRVREVNGLRLLVEPAGDPPVEEPVSTGVSDDSGDEGGIT